MIFHILKTLSVLPYYLFYENAMMGSKLLHSQQQGTPSYLRKATKEKMYHSEDASFPTLCLCWHSYFYVCESVDSPKENRNFNLKRERKRGKEIQKRKKKTETEKGKESKRNLKRNKREIFKGEKRGGKRKKKKEKKWKKDKTFLDETSRWEC